MSHLVVLQNDRLDRAASQESPGFEWQQKPAVCRCPLQGSNITD